MDEYKIYKYFVEHNLMKEIEILEGERDRLNSIQQAESTVVEQIQSIDKELSLKKEELEKVRKSGPTVKMIDLMNGTLIDDETKKKLMEEIKNDEEYNHKQTFSQIKQLYKTAEGRSFDRFKNAISGKKPKWRKVLKFSQKELDYLLATYRGETLLTSGEIRYVEGRDDLDISLKEKMVKDSNWRAFTNLLQKHELVKSHLVSEGNRTYGRK